MCASLIRFIECWFIMCVTSRSMAVFLRHSFEQTVFVNNFRECQETVMLVPHSLVVTFARLPTYTSLTILGLAQVFFYVLTVAFDVPGRRQLSNRQFFEASLSTSWFDRSVGFQWAGVAFCCTFAPVFLHKCRPILMFKARSAFRALVSGHLQNFFSDTSHSHW